VVTRMCISAMGDEKSQAVELPPEKHKVILGQFTQVEKYGDIANSRPAEQLPLPGASSYNGAFKHQTQAGSASSLLSIVYRKYQHIANSKEYKVNFDHHINST
jgi:hypothetical protein